MLYTYLIIGFLLAVFINLATNRKELIATPKERFLTTVWIIITWFPVCIDLYLNELIRKNKE